VRHEEKQQRLTGDGKGYALKIQPGILSFKRGSDLVGQNKNIIMFQGDVESNQLDAVEYQIWTENPFLNMKKLHKDKFLELFLTFF